MTPGEGRQSAPRFPLCRGAQRGVGGVFVRRSTAPCQLHPPRRRRARCGGPRGRTHLPTTRPRRAGDPSISPQRTPGPPPAGRDPLQAPSQAGHALPAEPPADPPPRIGVPGSPIASPGRRARGTPRARLAPASVSLPLRLADACAPAPPLQVPPGGSARAPSLSRASLSPGTSAAGSRRTMIATAKEKNKNPKDSMTLLPCFYFVEVSGACGVSGGPPRRPKGQEPAQVWAAWGYLQRPGIWVGYTVVLGQRRWASQDL